MTELPVMNSSAYANTFFQQAGAQLGQQNLGQAVRAAFKTGAEPSPPLHIAPKPERKKDMTTRRLVQVFMLDPDENVPLADALLYQSGEKLTDLTDQELFYEIDIKSILEKHNAVRAKIVNKAVRERAEYLDPIRVRDLRMTVVLIAGF